MNKSLLVVILFLLFASIASAQSYTDTTRKNPKPRFWDRVFFGGGGGLQFGSVTLINIAPMAGYRITEKLSAGVTATYLYADYKDFDFSTSIYGGGIFGRYYFIQNLFAHAEYEVLNLEAWNTGERITIENILGGGGYRQSLGGRSSVNLMILWNFNESMYSIYGNPIIRMGVGIGI